MIAGLLFKAVLHDTARILMQHARKRQGGCGSINGYFRIAFQHQFEGPGVVRVSMSDQHSIQPARTTFQKA